MRRFFLPGLTLLFLTVLMYSCQKELSFEVGQLAQGTLQGAGGECLPKSVNGTYRSGQALGDTNYIDVSVQVTTPGAYTITTDTLNGYYFKATGSFADTGVVSVRLKGAGTPSNAGINDFSIRFSGTLCFVPVTVVPGTTQGGSAFSLEGAGGACTSSNVAGTYTQGTALTNANQVVLSVNVTTIGTWSLSSNTVAGITFSGSGNFTSTGVQNITLNGAGTPTASGPQTFSVSATGGACTFVVTVVPNATPPATFTLSGGPGACINSSVNGTYTQGTALGATNTITVEVNVTVAGSYTISTNTVSGMSFTASGNFASTGVQNVTLNGSGTPTASGAQTLTVTAGTSTCTVSITVGTGGTPSGNCLPLTPSTYWTYNDGFSTVPTDTIKRIVNGTATHGGNNYVVVVENDNSGTPAWEYHFRKAGNDYFEYARAHDYALMTFDAPVPEGDILFLKENATTGMTWLSNEFTGEENGTATKLRYAFECVDENGTATINGKNFSNVVKIKFKSQTSVGGGAFQDEGLVWDAWYARGIGLIHMKATYLTNTVEWNIRFWQVN